MSDIEATPRRSSRNRPPLAGNQPPLSAAHLQNRGATPGSSLTARELATPTRHGGQRQSNEDQERINEMGLARLADEAAESPVVRLDNVIDDFEAVCDKRAHDENAGASDSEDEASIGMPVEDMLERQQHLADSLAALMDDMEAIGETINNMNNNNNNNEGGNDDAPSLPGAPPGWKPPTAPEGWKPDALLPGQPEFKDVDNPGGWSEFTYRPKCATALKTVTKDGKKKKVKVKECKHHALPTGCTVVPKDDNGERKVKDWSFHYQGWKPVTETKFRSGATHDNLFPAERNSSLDVAVLKEMGLELNRLIEVDRAPDALFFYQLLLPIHCPDKTDIANDPRKGFYVEVARYTNCYALGELECGADCGHHFHPVTSPELLRWDGTLVKHGVRGGGKTSMMLRFDKSRDDNSAFDADMSSAFTRTRWCEIKRCIKLCDNRSAIKKGQPNYEPAYKYNKIFEVLIHNLNSITKHACADQCVDESTFGHGGYGPLMDGLFGYLRNKPFTKGGQIALACDVDRIRPRACVHRHNAHPTILPGPTGPNEIALIYEKLEHLILAGQSLNPNRPVPIFREPPHVTADNHFSGEAVMKHAVEKGFGLLMTCRRDRFPKDMPTMFVQKEKTDSGPRPKAARYQNPVVAIKKEANDIQQLVSFQSTSSCNFIGVNSLNAVDFFVTPKERGRAKCKRHWAIEMNEGRKLHLAACGGVDRMDHCIKNCCMGYRQVPN